MALRPPSRHTLLAIACMCHTYAALLSSISHLSLQLKSAKSFTVHSKSIVPSARYHRRAKLNLRNCSVSRLASATEGDDANTSSSNSGHGIDLSENPNLVGVTLPRAPGVEWGTDLSFSFVYIREIDPSGAAAASGLVEKGDQLCAVGDSNVIGLPFDAVMTIIASLKGKTMDLVLFRGTKEELIAACSNKDEYEGGGKADTIKITVIVDPGDGKGGKAKRKEIRELIVPKGSNVREVLTENGINVYQSLTRWTNCSGKQLCGTCIVNIKDGANGTNRKSMDEESTLRDNPDSYRLSCVTFAYNDIIVETFPPIKAYQWTR